MSGYDYSLLNQSTPEEMEKEADQKSLQAEIAKSREEQDFYFAIASTIRRLAREKRERLNVGQGCDVSKGTLDKMRLLLHDRPT
jgi:hypothetical protein